MLVRTPVGKYGGALSSIRPDDLLAHVIKALLERNRSIDVNAIEDVIAGDANQAGEDNRNVARMAALLAGLPVTVAGNTVNRLCASGLQAIMDACKTDHVWGCGIDHCRWCGKYDKSAFCYGKSNYCLFNARRKFMILQWAGGLSIKNWPIMYYPYSMGETAENVAKQWNIIKGRTG